MSGRGRRSSCGAKGAPQRSSTRATAGRTRSSTRRCVLGNSSAACTRLTAPATSTNRSDARSTVIAADAEWAQRPIEQGPEQPPQRQAVALVDLARQAHALRTGGGDPQQDVVVERGRGRFERVDLPHVGDEIGREARLVVEAQHTCRPPAHGLVEHRVVLVEHGPPGTPQPVAALPGQPHPGPPGVHRRLDVAVQQARQLVQRGHHRGPRLVARHHLELAPAEAVVDLDPSSARRSRTQSTVPSSK
ncbi:MAG: hypothetical protein K0R87_2133 [Pseudonocardia sp.]|nr:hypothetical protein [Pseudonocardia sp.]